MLKLFVRLYYAIAFFILANYLWLLWSAGQANGWSGWATGASIRFSYILSLGVGLSGVALALYGRYRRERATGISIAAAIASYGFIDLTVRRLLM